MSRRRVRIHPRFYVFMLLFLAILTLMVWGVVALFRGGAAVQWGTLSGDRTGDALIVRREQVIYAGEYASRAEALAAEGEEVTAGQPVMDLYTAGYSSKDMQNYWLVQQKIKDAQENDVLKNIADPKLEDLNARIDAKQEEISQTLPQGLGMLLKQEGELAQLMEERRLYMRELTQANATEYLTGLYQSESQLLERMEAAKKQALSPMDGVVSFFLDGCQDTLSPDALPALELDTALEMVGELQAGKQAAASGGQLAPDTPLLRVVDPSSWYVVMVFSGEKLPIAQGQTCQLTLDGYPTSLDGQVLRLDSKGRQHMAVLQVNAPMGSMLSLRKVKGHLGGHSEGFKVPSKALDTQGGQTVLTVVSGGEKQTLAVKVLAEDAAFALVEPLDAASALAVGDKVVMP